MPKTPATCSPPRTRRNKETTLTDEFRMLADDLYSVEGHNRYASALSKAADEIERLQGVIAGLRVRIEAVEQQELVAWMSSRNGFIRKENKNPDYNMPLIHAPCAKGE